MEHAQSVRQESGLRMPECWQLTKMKPKAITTARISARKLKPARSLAGGLKMEMTTMEMPSAVTIPIMLELPKNRLAAEGLVRNWNSTNLDV